MTRVHEQWWYDDVYDNIYNVMEQRWDDEIRWDDDSITKRKDIL